MWVQLIGMFVFDILQIPDGCIAAISTSLATGPLSLSLSPNPNPFQVEGKPY